MKKLIFLFVMVFAVGMAMSQNTATVNQDGNSNSGIVDQSGGNGNDAMIDQYGTNIALIEQIGNSNTGDIDQGAEGSAVTNSGPQTSWLYGSFIYQEGDNNRAIADINYGSNGTSIYQKGNWNIGEQELNAGGSYTTSWAAMGVDLDQIGNYNTAYQTTAVNFGCGPIHGLSIVQQGNDNWVNQLSIGGAGNVQNVTQIGNNNNNSLMSGHVLDISATGLSNPLDLPFTFNAQSSYTSIGDITQYSNQMGGVAHIYVEGNDNNTYQYQQTSWSNSGNTANLDLYGNTNDVVQGQKGDFNSSDIDIDGDGNVVTSSQFGDNNIVDVDLLAGSNNNVVGIEQEGDWHSATVSQSGISNFAKIIQQ